MIILAVAGMLALAVGIPYVFATGRNSTPRVTAGPPNVTSRDLRLLYQAEQLLIRDCMRRHGFQYHLVPIPQVTADQRFPYVIDDVAWAERNGYGGSGRANASDEDPNSGYIDGLPPSRRAAYGVAINGVGPGGPGVLVTLPQGGVLGQSSDSCRSSSEETLYGDLQTWFRADRIAGDLLYLRQTQVMNDPRYQRAVALWAQCMRTGGYSYASPAAAAAAFAESSSPREIPTAVAEAKCAIGTGMATTVRQLDGSYANTLREKYRSYLETDQRLEFDALPRARAIEATAAVPR